MKLGDGGGGLIVVVHLPPALGIAARHADGTINSEDVMPTLLGSRSQAGRVVAAR